jgi:hypothetical protein
MLRSSLVFTLVSFLAIGFVSCGQGGEKGGDRTAEQAKVPGTVKESANFKILVPEGWEFMAFSDGTVQTYNKSMTYMVEAKKAGYNMTEKDVELLIGNLAKQYNGTPVEKVEMLGLSFFKTTYTANSSRQTMYNALKDGAKISITLMGPDHEKDATIQAVFKSVALK